MSFCVGLAAVQAGQAPRLPSAYSVTELGLPNPAPPRFEICALNDTAQAVAYCNTPPAVFRHDPGVGWQDLGAMAGSAVVSVSDINNTAQICGTSIFRLPDNSDSWTISFVCGPDGVFQALHAAPPLDGDRFGSQAVAINNAGQVALRWLLSTFTTAARSNPGSGLQILGLPQDHSFFPNAISANGDIAGLLVNFGLNPFRHAAVWRAGGGLDDLTPALAPPAERVATAINANGLVAGLHSESGQTAAWLRQADGTFQDLSGAATQGLTGQGGYRMALNESGVLSYVRVNPDSSRAPVLADGTAIQSFTAALQGSGYEVQTGDLFVDINNHGQLLGYVHPAGSNGLPVVAILSELETPVITNVQPAKGTRGQQGLAIVVNGDNFAAGATLRFSGSGITVRNVVVQNAGQITAVLDLAANAALGNRNVTVTNPDSRSGTRNAAFTISAPPSTRPPGITGVDPKDGFVGAQNLALIVNGRNFRPGAQLQMSGSGITLKNVTRESETRLTALADLDAAATPGTRAVTVTNSDGTTTTRANAFTVRALPVLSRFSAAPARVQGGRLVTLTLMLSGPAPPEGALVTFTSSNDAVAAPPPVTIPSMRTRPAGAVRWTSPAVTATQVTTLTATYNGSGKTATVTLDPPRAR